MLNVVCIFIHIENKKEVCNIQTDSIIKQQVGSTPPPKKIISKKYAKFNKYISQIKGFYSARNGTFDENFIINFFIK